MKAHDRFQGGALRTEAATRGRRIAAIALGAALLVLPACSSGGHTVVVTVTATPPPAAPTVSPVESTGGTGSGVTSTTTQRTSPPATTTSRETTATTTQRSSRTATPESEAPTTTGDAAWFVKADGACRDAIEEYGEWKSAAGGRGAAPEALALGAAAAATHAATAIQALPRPTSREALNLRTAVWSWAAAYRDLATAMDSGTFSEETAAFDASEAAAARIRSAAGTAAPSCVAMVHDV